MKDAGYKIYWNKAIAIINNIQSIRRDTEISREQFITSVTHWRHKLSALNLDYFGE